MEDIILDEFDLDLLLADDPFEVMLEQRDYKVDARHYLFVYGTMMAGHSNHHRVAKGEKIGRTITVNPRYSMFTRLTSKNTVAPVVTDDGNNYIAGELYRVSGPMLRDIDLAEGHPVTYERQLVKILDPKGESVYMAWIYFYVGEDSLRGTAGVVYDDDLLVFVEENV